MHPISPLHTELNGEQLAALIEDAALAILREYDKKGGIECAEDIRIESFQAELLDMLQNVDGKKAVSELSAELAEHVTKCWYALSF